MSNLFAGTGGVVTTMPVGRKTTTPVAAAPAFGTAAVRKAKPVKVKTYGAAKYPVAPAPISGEQVASFQDQMADANAGVRQAMAELAAGKAAAAHWQRVQNRSISNAVGDAYTGQMSAAGADGVGRMALVQSNLKNDLVEQENAQRGAITQQVAEKNGALAAVLAQAQAKKNLTRDAIARRRALLGADVAQLIRGGSN